MAMIYDKELVEFLKQKMDVAPFEDLKVDDAVYYDGFGFWRGFKQKEICVKVYEKALESMAQWLKVVCMASYVYTGKNEFYCDFLLPGKKHLIISSDVSIKADGKPLWVEEELDNIYTPIGELSSFVIDVIQEIPNNPVELFYRFIEDCCKELAKEMGSSRDLLSNMQRRRVANEKVIDFLEVYTLLPIMQNLDIMFPKAKK